MATIKSPPGSVRAARGFFNLIKASIDKYGAALFALISFLVQGSSAISAASAIISHSSFGHIFDFVKVPPFRARAGAAVINECD
jgi:hypothetical protein